MSLLTIIEVPDPRLRLTSEPVDVFDDALATLVDDMFETMYDAPGIGLAAIQVAVPKRVVVIDLQEREDGGEDDADGGEPVRNPRVFINPEIVWISAELSSYNEGCLSIPEQFGEVERPARIRARWQDRDGSTQVGEIDGLLATCLQHEIDHLNGVLFLDHLSRLKRDMLLKKLDKFRRGRSG